MSAKKEYKQMLKNDPPIIITPNYKVKLAKTSWDEDQNSGLIEANEDYIGIYSASQALKLYNNLNEFFANHPHLNRNH